MPVSEKKTRELLCNTGTMTKMLQKMTDIETKALKPFKKGFQSTQELKDMCDSVVKTE